MSEQSTCEVVLGPEERRLLAAVLARHGIGADYLALRRRRRQAGHAKGRPLPRWLAKRRLPPAAPTPARAVAPLPGPSRRCQDCRCLHGQRDGRYLCSVGVWTQPMQPQSVRASARLRLLARACPRYVAVPPVVPPVVHHCRACAALQRVQRGEERYVCRYGVWSNPMKPLSVANARRLATLSAHCAHFAPGSGRRLPRR